MGTIRLKNIRAFAFHGCLEEESLIGSDYRVDIEAFANLNKASQSDNLGDTVDYVLINDIAKEEMQIRSRLLEHVAKRIINRLFSEQKMISKVKVAVSKLNPPIGGDVEAVTVILKEKRN